MLRGQDLLERRRVGMARERVSEVPPVRLFALELAEQTARLLDVAGPGGVDEREPADVGAGQAARAADLGASSLNPVRRPGGLGEVDEPTALEDRAFAPLDAQVEHALPRLALGRHDDHARA